MPIATPPDSTPLKPTFLPEATNARLAYLRDFNDDLARVSRALVKRDHGSHVDVQHVEEAHKLLQPRRPSESYPDWVSSFYSGISTAINIAISVFVNMATGFGNYWFGYFVIFLLLAILSFLTEAMRAPVTGWMHDEGYKLVISFIVAWRRKP